jgi:glucose/arabinose dehydrogenase
VFRVIFTFLLLISVASIPTTLRPTQAGPVVPAGFNIEVFYPGLTNPTSMTWGPDGNLYVSQQGGEVIELTIGSDGFPIGSSLLAKVPPTLLGLVFVGPDLYVSYTGSVARLTLQNGKVSSTQVVLDGLPYGRHQNDEIIYGKDGFLYMGIGSTGDRTNGNDPRSATIVRFRPDGSGFEIFAKGLRNPYGLTFDKDGNLFATDNGPDDPVGPDELNYIVKGGDYGFPNYFGTPPAGSGTIGPVVNLQLHSSSDGFTFYYGDQFPAEYVGNAFIAQWGANSGDPNIGRRIVRVPVTRTDDGFVGQEIVFATGFDHPLDIIDDHRGSLLVADYGAGIIYKISHGPTQTQSSTLLCCATAPIPPPVTTLESFPAEFVLLVVLVILGIGLVLAARRTRKNKSIV